MQPQRRRPQADGGESGIISAQRAWQPLQAIEQTRCGHIPSIGEPGALAQFSRFPSQCMFTLTVPVEMRQPFV
jgi:hypothetical protein